MYLKQSRWPFCMPGRFHSRGIVQWASSLILVSLSYVVGQAPQPGTTHNAYCGADQFTDNGVSWVGQSYVRDGKATFLSTSRSIEGAGSLLPVYQSVCEGDTIEFIFPISKWPGLYEVTLYGAEVEYTEPGWRTFNVICGNGLVQADLDWAREAGPLTAVSKKFVCNVTMWSLSVVLFSTSFSGVPVNIGGVSVAPAGDGAAAPPTPTAPPYENRDRDMWVEYVDSCNTPCFNGKIRESWWDVIEGDGADYGLDSWGDGGLQCFVNSTDTLRSEPIDGNPATQDHVIRLTARKEAGPVPCRSKNGAESQRQYRSARIITKKQDGFTWDGNITAARAMMVWLNVRFPNGPPPKGFWFSVGLVPIAQLTSGRWPTSPAVTTFEAKGEMVFSHVHFEDLEGVMQERSAEATRFKTEDANKNPNVWRFVYAPWYMRSSFDFSKYEDTWGYWWPETWQGKWWDDPDPTAPFTQPMQFMVQIGVGGARGGDVDPDLPAGFEWPVEIDYLRVEYGGIDGEKRPQPTDPAPITTQPSVPQMDAAPVAAMYCGEQPFSGPAGRTFSRQYITGAEYTSTPRHVYNSADLDEVFKTECHGQNMQVDVPLSGPGSFLVTIMAAELMLNKPGQRVFDVQCEGAVMMADVDIFVQAGPRQAWTRAFYCTSQDATLTLNFVSKTTRYLGKFGGILVQPANGVQLPPSPPAQTSSPVISSPSPSPPPDSPPPTVDPSPSPSPPPDSPPPVVDPSPPPNSPPPVEDSPPPPSETSPPPEDSPPPDSPPPTDGASSPPIQDDPSPPPVDDPSPPPEGDPSPPPEGDASPPPEGDNPSPPEDDGSSPPPDGGDSTPPDDGADSSPPAGGDDGTSLPPGIPGDDDPFRALPPGGDGHSLLPPSPKPPPKLKAPPAPFNSSEHSGLMIYFEMVLVDQNGEVYNLSWQGDYRKFIAMLIKVMEDNVMVLAKQRAAAGGRRMLQAKEAVLGTTIHGLSAQEAGVKSRDVRHYMEDGTMSKLMADLGVGLTTYALNGQAEMPAGKVAKESNGLAPWALAVAAVGGLAILVVAALVAYRVSAPERFAALVAAAKRTGQRWRLNREVSDMEPADSIRTGSRTGSLLRVPQKKEQKRAQSWRRQGKVHDTTGRSYAVASSVGSSSLQRYYRESPNKASDLSSDKSQMSAWAHTVYEENEAEKNRSHSLTHLDRVSVGAKAHKDSRDADRASDGGSPRGSHQVAAKAVKPRRLDWGGRDTVPEHEASRSPREQRGRDAEGEDARQSRGRHGDEPESDGDSGRESATRWDGSHARESPRESGRHGASGSADRQEGRQSDADRNRSKQPTTRITQQELVQYARRVLADQKAPRVALEDDSSMDAHPAPMHPSHAVAGLAGLPRKDIFGPIKTGWPGQHEPANTYGGRKADTPFVHGYRGRNP